MIHDMFVFYDFEIFSNFQKWPKFLLLRENCSRNCKIKIFSLHFKSDLESPINSLFDLINFFEVINLSLLKIIGGGGTPHCGIPVIL